MTYSPSLHVRDSGESMRSAPAYSRLTSASMASPHVGITDQSEAAETLENRTNIHRSNLNFKMGEYGRQILMISLFTYFGVGARILLSLATDHIGGINYPLLSRMDAQCSMDAEAITCRDMPVETGYFFPNIVGTVVMGFAAAWEPWTSKHFAHVHLAITTGFCGACTTFATWAQAINLQLIGGKTAVDAMILMAVQLMIFYLSHRLGFHIGKYCLIVDRKGTEKKPPLMDDRHLILQKVHMLREQAAILATETKPFTTGDTSIDSALQSLDSSYATIQEILERKDSGGTLQSCLQDESSQRLSSLPLTPQDLTCALGPLFLALTAMLWILAALDKPERRKYWLSCAVGPIGSLLRWYLSQYNSKIPVYPAFTLLANLGGLTIDAVTHVALSLSEVEATLWTTALTTGIAGSLSTVSTFVNEIVNLRIKWGLLISYRYFISTLIAAQLLGVAINGSYKWAKT